MTSVHEAASDEMVTCPPHYMAGPYECEIVEEALSEKMAAEGVKFNERFMPYQVRLYFAAFEYLWRAPFKNGVEDLKKCRRDIDRLIETLEGRHESD